MKSHATLVVTVRRIRGSDRYSVRVGGMKLGEIRRDDYYGWDWVRTVGTRFLDDDALTAVAEATHRAMRTTPHQWHRSLGRTAKGAAAGWEGDRNG